MIRSKTTPRSAGFLLLVLLAAGANASQEIEVPSLSEWDKKPRPEWKQFEKIEQSQEWFEVYRVLPGVFAIYEPGHYENVISYLIAGSERALLFDTGLGIGDIRKACSELTGLDVVVLLSHAHYDHIGGNHAFEAVWGADTAFSRKASKGIPKDRARGFLPQDFTGSTRKPLPKGFDIREYHIKPYRISHFVKDGEVIDLGGRTLEVVVTPGHTPDSLCLLDRENRALYTGDTFYLGPILAHLGNSDVVTYYASTQRLAGLEPQIDWILPAHSPPTAEPVWLSRFRDAFRAVVEGKKEYALSESPLGPGEVRNYVFDGFWILTRTNP